jgi:hypothetical protein
MAINPPLGLENEFGFIQKSLPVPELTASGLECLNHQCPVNWRQTPVSRIKVSGVCICAWRWVQRGFEFVASERFGEDCEAVS